MKKSDISKISLIVLLCAFILTLSSCTKHEEQREISSIVNQYNVDTIYSEGSFQLAKGDDLAVIYVGSLDYPGVFRAAQDLQADINRVTGNTPLIVREKNKLNKNTVIIGTIGKNSIIDKLIRNSKINVEQISGKWESFLIEVVPNPLRGIENALVIAGSDKRGTIYGIYTISEQIGVSPWYWWADVPVEHKDNLYITAGRYVQGPPAVKYRGIFLNDEWPSMGGWAHEKFGGFNHKFYENVFELILRLKGNFLWPAMWSGAFADDDPLNAQLADEYGIVMGTSHHEPMNRAHQEWRRYGKGPWDYSKNEEVLKSFWREGIERSKNYETIITLAMRGDGDMAMSEETNIALLERIVADQRKIISEIMDKNLSDIPQVWALYKEVQDYYDKGMRVPDDVTLLLCDDNWGNVRILPKPDAPPRKGGYGMYYHFDFVGGPRCYKWLNTNQIATVWEQMHLTYRYGVDRIWVVNVGDLKPMEFPISFFLDYAWSPDKLPAESLPEYTKLWAGQQFGPKYADDIADILNKYTKYNARRKPELLSPDTYSLINYKEYETVVSDYNKLSEKAEKIYEAIPAKYKNAYYQLVLYPVKACANLNELYFVVAKNRLYAKQGRVLTNELAEKAKELFTKDAELSDYYNKIMSDGKWNHMMDQVHIGYTSWAEPKGNIMPNVETIESSTAAEMGVVVEGSDNETDEVVLPEFDVYQKQTFYIDIFNRGEEPFDYEITSGAPFLIIESNEGRIEKEQRVLVSVDWNKVPAGKHKIPITVKGAEGKKVIVYVVVNNPTTPKPEQVKGFVEGEGYVSIEAEHYTKAVNADPVEWLTIPDEGRTLSGVTPIPVTAKSQMPNGDSPRLEYAIHFFSSGKVKVSTYMSPVQNFNKTQGLRYAISFDDEQPQIINIHENDIVPDWKYAWWWSQMVSDSIKIATSEHNITEPGEHVLKFWMIDPGVVLQKIVIDTGGVKKSYLGPPESYHN
jgi:hypothetical protein